MFEQQTVRADAKKGSPRADVRDTLQDGEDATETQGNDRDKELQKKVYRVLRRPGQCGAVLVVEEENCHERP